MTPASLFKAFPSDVAVSAVHIAQVSNSTETSLAEVSSEDSFPNEKAARQSLLTAFGDKYRFNHKFLRFLAHSKLGEGAFGVVWKAIKKSQGLKVAIKQQPLPTGNDEKSEKLLASMQSEAEIQELVSGVPYVMPLIEIKSDATYFYTVMPLAQGWQNSYDLKTLSSPLTGSSFQLVAAQMALAIRGIHLKGVAHLDIKADNFLLDGEMPSLSGRGKTPKVHLADFGVSLKSDTKPLAGREAEFSFSIHEKERGSRYYWPAELGGSFYDPWSWNVDWFEFGVTLLTLAAGEAVLPKKGFAHMDAAFLHKDLDQIQPNIRIGDETLAKSLIDLLKKKLLVPDRSERFSSFNIEDYSGDGAAGFNDAFWKHDFWQINGRP
eukprot:CAMPEP_0197635470 /NCGR_PEP_ID=MMETSP1338-20131121/11275_1 /TAXON_ID=43686 ORGANISM="Pelagodinium beii, Strain RCC1491" /NCGR_SAMPLE_ID=MMETSP1338 /ASSEMBLY_ACC=CAM_ASM_000754 /LENGTH=377 /DNA_ID=CAMNT_0043207529 /DNA_START=197 /DNA_END=1325 /DNA_ORIENTATION=-